jgi:hypothetical protein
MVVADPFVTQDSVTRTIKRALTRASLDPAVATINLTGWRAGMGNPATVAISYPYKFSIVGPLLKWTTSQSSITLRTSFVMRNE